MRKYFITKHNASVFVSKLRVTFVYLFYIIAINIGRNVPGITTLRSMLMRSEKERERERERATK